ncbi:pyridoxal phosphate-dependent aminotransferase [Limosilactobacillus sp. STM2_1]|uniref:Pyridoxal phosphate-dependent aminotransferase n=1 Tax=Limosilactobacillus rudii TaxID=2759755 RepID=A0A7W3YNQ2_9LACO|nr:pyridoxal phosphate-dependent aminotransferase [Limosilactobacillus rudii]MBB1080377.1 pyridoxal phosphate-dependent aminotransferase [Limosilactobacillus rudii]MBB1098403.1 pyridoxal phosphate-dependent aminotransferase [Limosilactobacillus rudii]MCD7135411.1 pyridoxal phosphate-dependent aminotransferase [Limosilactobacillus rudii]
MKFEQSRLLDGLPKQFFANLVAKVNKKVDEGVDVINLGQGNPDKPTPDYIVKSTQKWVADPQTHKYSLFRGLPAFKQAAADFYHKKYGAQFDPEKEVAILGGSKIGLVELPWALMNPGDTYLLPDPGYPDYLSGAALGKVNFVTVPLLAENNFLPDLDAIPEETAKKAKFFYLNYPNNPTGAVATPEFYEKLVSWAKKYQVGIISDFAYGAIGFDGKAPVSFMQTPGAKDVGIEFYTFSKTFNMAGWRIAFAVGNQDIIEALNLIQDHLFVSLFPALQRAAIDALTAPQRDSAVATIVGRYEERRNAFVEAAEKIGWHAFIPRGTFYAWMPVPAGYTSEQFADVLLNKAGVAVAPGNGFGTHGEGYVRIGLLIEPERLVEAVNRIGKLHLFD